MGGIVGVFDFGAMGVDPVVLEAMSAVTSHRGPDGVNSYLSPKVGFIYQHFRVTPESLNETQPFVHSHTGVVGCLDGRLDSRQQLLDWVQDSAVDKGLPDIEIAIAAYLKQPATFLERFKGDFALAIYDPRDRSLLLARDCVGVKQIYYCVRKNQLLFASEIKALLAHPNVEVEIDQAGLNDTLLGRSVPFGENEGTCFRGIQAVAPSCWVKAANGEVQSHQYWDFDPTHTIRYSTYEQYCEAFSEVFEEAVRRRTRSSSSVLVSVGGGLDSSSVYCQAQQQWTSEEGPEIVALSYRGRKGTVADEEFYLRAIENQWGVEATRITMDGSIDLLSDMRTQVKINEVPMGGVLWGLSQEIRKVCHNRNARVILSGHFGDQILFIDDYLRDLFFKGAWLKVVKHLNTHGDYYSDVPKRYFYQEFLKSLLRESLPKNLVSLIKDIRSFIGFTPVDPRDMLGPAFSSGLGFGHASHDSMPQYGSAQAKSVYQTVRSPYHVLGLEASSKNAAYLRQDLRLPFLDQDLIAFMMAIPGEIQNNDGIPRGLLRSSMKGIVPDVILKRRDKADFTAEVELVLSQHEPNIKQLFGSEFRCKDLQLLNLNTLNLLNVDTIDQTRGLNGARVKAALALEMWVQEYEPRPSSLSL